MSGDLNRGTRAANQTAMQDNLLTQLGGTTRQKGSARVLQMSLRDTIL